MSINEAIQKYKELVAEIETKKASIDELLKQAQTAKQKIEATLSDSEASGKRVADIEKSLKTINSNIDILTQSTQANKKTFDQLLEKAKTEQTEITTIKEDVQSLLNTTKEQSESVADLLQKASAGRLFASFKIRKDEVGRGAFVWGIMIALSIIILVGITIRISNSFTDFSSAFWVKTTISAPILYWLLFSSREFSKNRRLEEEYAFKSAISLSIEAYRDLLKKESADTTTKTHVIPFITEAVSKIYTSPSQTISKFPQKNEDDIPLGILEKLAGILKSFVKPL